MGNPELPEKECRDTGRDSHQDQVPRISRLSLSESKIRPFVIYGTRTRLLSGRGN